LIGRELGEFRALGTSIAIPLGSWRPILEAPLRVAALRRTSRETVDGALPIRRAISLNPAPSAFKMAISSRSANDK